MYSHSQKMHSDGHLPYSRLWFSTLICHIRSIAILLQLEC